MKRRFPAYMCDSLGDSNQARVHFLGIGSQLRGADVPRVIKCSQPVIDCTSVVTANIPEQKKNFVKLKAGESRGILPLTYGLWSSWDVRNLHVNLGDRANRLSDAACTAWPQHNLQRWGFHQNKQFAKLRNPWTSFSFPVATGKGCLLSLSPSQNDVVCSSLSLFP